MDEAALIINGMSYGGWTGISVTRDIERMSGAFQLDLTDKWPGIEEKRAVKPGFKCQLMLDNEPLVTGHLDTVDMSISAGDHTLTAVGRDKTADLIDCTAHHLTGEWRDTSLIQIARDLCQPFGIVAFSLIAAANEPIKLFKLEESETAFSAIERLCRIQGLLATSSTDGNVVLTQSEEAVELSNPLRTGKNATVLSANARFDHAQRFSKITVKGQDGGDDFSDPADATEPAANTIDNLITRYRPLTVLAEEQVDAKACQTRADWEVSVRRGRSRILTATVQGWHHADDLWRPLTKVPCEIPEINLNGMMLISAVTYSKSADAGTTATLTLSDPDAFSVISVEQAPVESWGW